MHIYRWLGVLVSVLLVLTQLSCGGQGSGAPNLGEQRAQQAQLNAMPTPAGVNSDLWGQLKTELARVLDTQRSVKHTLAAPLDAHSKVPDLAVSLGTGGAADFTFSYRNTGDYDQNGQVGLTDLVQVGIHFGKTSASADWQKAQVADGTFDGAVGIPDVTPIGQRWLKKVEGYELQVSATPDPGASWSIAAEIALGSAVVPGAGGFKQFAYSLSAPVAMSYYRVVPFEGAAAARTHGIPSDAVQFNPSAPPAPTGLAASDGTFNDKIVLSWTKSAGATGYKIYRDAQVTPITTVGDVATYDDLTVADVTIHTYWLKATDGTNESGFSAPDDGHKGGLAAPSDLYATDGDYIDKVALKWTKVTGATGYKIYRDAQASLLATVGDVAVYDDAGVADTSMHTYWLKATDGTNDSGLSVSNDGYKGSAFASTYVVLGWNDLGMHCMNQDFSTLMILPPYNTLHAQIILRGDDPQIVTGGVTVDYSIPGNTTSVTKTNFWDYANSLLGVTLAPDTGLTGHGLSGAMTSLVASGRNDWNVTGIPITPLNDAMQLNSYALSRISVLQGAALVAETQAVVPVSWEISCDLCHASNQAILAAHDNLHGTGLASATPVLCGNCHAQPELGLTGMTGVPSLSSSMHSSHAPRMGMAGLAVDCYACHPGQVTMCLRDVHFSAGLTCLSCHGDMVAVGNPTRVPWSDEPRCSSCHNVAGHEYEQAGTLYRDSMGHNGVHCAACHGSPHAIQETVVPADNVQALALQGHAGKINTCTVCHTSAPGDAFNHTLGGD